MSAAHALHQTGTLPPDDLAFLAGFSQFFAVTRDLEATLETALAGITEGLGAAAGALFLIEESQAGDLVCCAAKGVPGLHGARVPLGGGILGRCLRHNGLEMTSGSAEEAGVLAGALAGRPCSVLCAPLATDARPFGAIQVVRAAPGAFGPRESYLLQTMANSAALAVANARLAEELAQRQVVQHELDLAAEIQRSLLPKARNPRFPVHGLNRPVRQVSGDFYDFFPLPDRRIAFALGDVSGKGMNAALLMARAASLFRCLGKRSDDPALVLSTINREIHETSSRGMFVTMVAGTYEPAGGLVRFANAGHEPPLLRRPDHSYQTFPAAAPPLGILPDAEFRTDGVELGEGEFYIFSDGLIEFNYGRREELGVDGLIQLLEGLGHLPLGARLEALVDELDQAGWEVRDDFTVLAIGEARYRADG